MASQFNSMNLGFPSVLTGQGFSSAGISQNVPMGFGTSGFAQPGLQTNPLTAQSMGLTQGMPFAVQSSSMQQNGFAMAIPSALSFNPQPMSSITSFSLSGGNAGNNGMMQQMMTLMNSMMGMMCMMLQMTGQMRTSSAAAAPVNNGLTAGVSNSSSLPVGTSNSSSLPVGTSNSSSLPAALASNTANITTSGIVAATATPASSTATSTSAPVINIPVPSSGPYPYTPPNSLYTAPAPSPASTSGSTPISSTPAPATQTPVPAPTPATQTPAPTPIQAAAPTPVPSTPTPSPTSSTPAPAPVPTPATPITPPLTDINITMIEPVGEHNAQVMGVLQNLVASDDIRALTQTVPGSVNVPQTLNELNQFIANDYVEPLNVASDNLQKILTENNPSNRVVNMSFGRTALTTMNFVKDALRANPRLLTQLGLPANASLDSVEVNQKLTNLVTSQISENPTVKQAMDRYQSLTRQASDQGIVVAVAAGNDQAALGALQAQGLSIDPTWALNNLVFSNSVIPVGGIDDKNTPNNFSDDTLTSFGSMGSSNLQPVVGADSIDVIGASGGNGTSFSTPQVAALAQKMLEINAKLTPAQIKSILIQTASHQVGGLPVIDMGKAMAEAQRLASVAA